MGSALRAEVVVYDIQDDSQPHSVASIDETLKSHRSVELRSHCLGQSAVVTPTAPLRRNSNWHNLHSSHFEAPQMLQARGGRFKRPLRGEQSDVHFIEHTTRNLNASPLLVGPGKRGGIEGPCWTRISGGELPSTGIRKQKLFIDKQAIVCAKRKLGGPVSDVILGHLDHTVRGLQRQFPDKGCPDPNRNFLHLPCTHTQPHSPTAARSANMYKPLLSITSAPPHRHRARSRSSVSTSTKLVCVPRVPHAQAPPTAPARAAPKISPWSK